MTDPQIIREQAASGRADRDRPNIRESSESKSLLFSRTDISVPDDQPAIGGTPPSSNLSDIERAGLERGVILAAIEAVKSETLPPLIGVPSRDQPWTQARARLTAAVEAYRNAGLPDA